MSDFTRKHNTEVIDDKKYEFGIDGDTYYDETEYGVKLKGSKDDITVLARKKYVDSEIATLKKYVDDENKKQDVKIDKNTADIVDLSNRVTVNETDIDKLQLGYGQLSNDVSILNNWYSKLTSGDIPMTSAKLIGFNTDSSLNYCINMNTLYISLYTGPKTNLAAATTSDLWTIPDEIAQRIPNIPFHEVSPSAMGATTGTVINFTVNKDVGNNTIKVYNDAAITTGARLNFNMAIPLIPLT